MKAKLTDFSIRNLKPKAEPYDVVDTTVAQGVDLTGFGIRVTGSTKSFIVYRRLSGSKSPVRRTLGRYPAMTLAEAREKADKWNRLIKEGLDPAVEAKRERQAAIEAEHTKEAATFGAALERYLEAKAKLRSVPHIKRELTNEFAGWKDKPLADISSRDVKEAIQRIVNRGTPTQAHFVFGMVRTFFNWVADSGDYGIELSPCARIKPAVLIGPRNVRERVLKDFELAAYWRASEAVGYPFGKLFQLLALTALRRDEAANAEWNEIDMEAKLWAIPAVRMKGNAAHVVPLVPGILTLLETLPRFVGGGFLFSTITGGRRPVSGFSKAKKRLDALMRAELEAQGKPFEPFVLHDIRRTVRTRLSALPIEDIVRERLMAHARPGLHRVYDLHAYEQEKARALDLWHVKLRHIIEPKPGNVIRLAAGA
jgi:integrase